MKELTHVINYSLPRELDLYVHRIGRTGRGGAEGLALSLVTPSHMGILYRIEKTINVKIARATLPSEDELLQIRLVRALADFEVPATQDAKTIAKIGDGILKSAWAEQIKNLSKEEIVARFLAKSLKIGKKIDDADTGSGRERGFRDREDSARPGNYAKRGFKDRPFSNDRPRGGDRPFRDRGAFGGASSGGGGYKKDYAPRKEGGYQKPASAFNAKSPSFKPSERAHTPAAPKAGGGRVFGRKPTSA